MHKLGRVILAMILLLPALPSLADVSVDDEIKAAEERLRYLQEKRAQEKDRVLPPPPATQRSEREIQLERELQREREQRLERELREIRQHQQRQAKSASTWNGVAIGCGFAVLLLIIIGLGASAE